MSDSNQIIETVRVPQTWREHNEALARAVRLASVFILVAAGLVLIVDGFARGFDARTAQWMMSVPLSVDVALYLAIAMIWLGPFAKTPRPQSRTATVLRVLVGAVVFALLILLRLSPPSAFAGTGIFYLAVGLFIAIDELKNDRGPNMH